MLYIPYQFLSNELIISATQGDVTYYKIASFLFFMEFS